MRLALYHGPRACSMVTLMTLYEAGADFELRPVNSRAGVTRSPEYLALNPKGKVPVLVIDGEPLTENVAILSWIAGAFPLKRLLPGEPKAAVKALSLMAWCASGLHPILPRMNFPERYCDAPESAAAVHRIAMADLVRQVAVADGLLAGREWVFDHFTLLDSYLWWVWYRATIPKVSMDPQPFPHFAAHAARMEKRDSVRRALALADELESQFARAA